MAHDRAVGFRTDRMAHRFAPARPPSPSRAARIGGEQIRVGRSAAGAHPLTGDDSRTSPIHSYSPCRVSRRPFQPRLRMNRDRPCCRPARGARRRLQAVGSGDVVLQEDGMPWSAPHLRAVVPFVVAIARSRVRRGSLPSTAASNGLSCSMRPRYACGGPARHPAAAHEPSELGNVVSMNAPSS
jgi:hypothetical protein